MSFSLPRPELCRTMSSSAFKPYVLWRFMHRVLEHEDRELIRRGDWASPTVRNLSHEFAVEHCRYAMPALRARLAGDGAVCLRYDLMEHFCNA